MSNTSQENTKYYQDLKQQYHCSILQGCKKFYPEYYNRPIHSNLYEFNPEEPLIQRGLEDISCLMGGQIRHIGNGISYLFRGSFKFTDADLKDGAICSVLEFSKWSTDNYLLLPAAAYNGNRFESRRIPYSPKLIDERDIDPRQPMIISDVPRLNIHEGPSRIQERSGSLSTPAIGFFSPGLNMVCWIFFDQQNDIGDLGISIEENKDRDKLQILFSSPVVRESYKYRIADNHYPSDDLPYTFKAGAEYELNFSVHFFESYNLQDLFSHFFTLRTRYFPNKEYHQLIPFSQCFSVQEKKFNDQNFVKDHGYYSVGMRDGRYPFLQDWQIGWTGGMISTFPLLANGNKETIRNVIRNFNWLFPNGISPSGFFYDAGEGGDQWYGGDIRRKHTANWHLIRKSGDALFYILKQFYLFQKKNIPVESIWKDGTRYVLNAMENLWKNNHQLGQFIDSISGEIIVGGSTSGAIVPAAFVLAASFYEEEHFITLAEEIAGYYYDRYISKGITCGGPGDALQNPDSESAYAMLESFVMLYEKTSNPKWLQYAEEMAEQFSTWVMSSNYQFPEESALGKLKIHTLGSVCANTQNKHGAPGICTFSGIALLKLYRYTGNMFYAELLQDITQHLPQNLSHPFNPIPGMKEGWMSERVSTTDWFEGIGELMYGSTWAETSLMLTYTEIPGLYIDLQRKRVFAFDQLQVEITDRVGKQMDLLIKNPTELDGVVKVFTDNLERYPVLNFEERIWFSDTMTIPAKKELKLSVPQS